MNQSFFFVLFFVGICWGSPYVRVNTLAYEQFDSKVAVLVSDSSLITEAYFSVVDSSGITVFLCDIYYQTHGSWSTTYGYTYSLDFSQLVHLTGTFYIEVKKWTGSSVALVATSPNFQISSNMNSIYDELVSNSIFFFKAQRDGPNVDSTVMNRQPSHLSDSSATVYSTPTFKSDSLSKTLTALTGASQIDISGGWFDAGDFLKFVQTASYVVDLMLVTYRDYSSALSTSTATLIENEALFGIQWLLKTWDPTKNVLYYQVGIGDGSSSITGDHDIWRLPEADDALNVKSGASEYFIKYRPVFQTGSTAANSLSPNLAGRLTAAFALCAQVFQTTNSSLASTCLSYATSIYGKAQVSPAPSTLVTTAPYDYYPETEWRDDMELGAIELYKATSNVNYLQDAANYAKSYNSADDSDSLNLYDVSGLAHYELAKVINQNTGISLSVGYNDLVNVLKSRVQSAITQGSKDPFKFGQVYDSGDDLLPHCFGQWIESTFVNELTGQPANNNSFANQQRDWIFGNNAWGASFVIGAGSNYPQCVQHQVANLAGSLTGQPSGNLQILLGAISDGPSDTANFDGLGVPDGAKACSGANSNIYSTFTGQGVKYMDDVTAWPSVEPADDYTVISLLAFARQAYLSK